MFSLAKLVGIASVIISSGTISSFTIPYLQEYGAARWLWEKNNSNEQYDFQELNEEADFKLKKLEEWFRRFLSAQKASEWLKKQEFQRIEQLFEIILNAEEQLKQLFQKISKSLSELLKKNSQIFNSSTQKLEREKEEKLQKTLKENYSSLLEVFAKWEDSLSEINCAIKQKEKNKCGKDKSSLSILIDSILSLTSPLTSNGAKIEKDTQETGSEKAKKELEEISKSLSKAIRDLQKKGNVYLLQQGYATSKEKIALLSVTYLSASLKILAEQIKELEKSISRNNQGTKETFQKIIELQQQLNISYIHWTNFKKAEVGFRAWSEIFKERILKNKSDKAREIQFTLNSK